MRIILLSAALLASGIASAAPPIEGWYIRGFGGYTFIPGNVENTEFGYFIHNSSFHNGYNVGGAAGYKSTPLRYEGEYTFIHSGAKAFRINTTPQSGITGYASSNYIMANIYYDTPEILPAISPFLGFGIGYAYIQESLQSLGPINGIAFYNSFGSFAYQGTVGLTYNFAENYAATLAYRYVATSSSGRLGNIFQSHNASAGVVYRFDYGDYK